MNTEPARLTTGVPSAPTRPADAHKGTFGTVLVVGGSATMPGAPALAARAALRAGAGLAKIASDAATLAIALGQLSSATGVRLRDDLEADAVALQEAADGKTILAIGPGWGPGREALLRAVLEIERPFVLDADGLNALARSGARLAELTPFAQTSVITPHPGEWRRLNDALPPERRTQADPTRPDQRAHAATSLARAHGCVVVLKGPRTVIANPESYVFNDTGNPALATGGTGDVLTGVIAALMAQGMSAFDAARLGVWVHGHAADHWSQTNGTRGLLAVELADLIPKSFEDTPR